MVDFRKHLTQEQILIAAVSQCSESEIFSHNPLSFNEKTGVSYRGMLCNCIPTKTCAKNCYACQGNISLSNCVLHAAKTDAQARMFPELVAKKISAQIPWQGIFRWFDRGDLSDYLLPIVNSVIATRKDVSFCVTSRKFDLLQEVSNKKNVVRLMSLDKDNYATTPVSKNIKYSYLQIDASEAIPDHVDVIYPLKKRSKPHPFYAGDSRFCTFSLFENVHCNDCRKCYSK